jgi:signal peptidase
VLRRLLALGIAFFLLVGVLPRTGLYHTVTALSGSMRPTFAPGDLLLVRPEPMRDLRVGQVITYAVPVGDHHVESHRVVAILRHGATPIVRTQGDANNTVDPWTAELHGSRVWVEEGRIPDLGWVIVGLRIRDVRLSFLYGAPLLFVLLGLVQIWRPQVRPRQRVALET